LRRRIPFESFDRHDARNPMNITPDLWRQLEPLLGSALEMGEGERARWLATIDATQPDVAPVLRKMLETHERAERSRELETVPKLAPAPLPSSAFSAGQRVGPFSLLRILGRGGMGEVWLAEQADGRVTRQVALKLPALHLQGGVWEERFHRERDILAKLTHPHIAHLFDAGVGESGQPYLAMEFVEGESLTDYANSHALGMRERLQLFRQVLAATAHAHRHLVVHRDLKPANILIDKTGQVKLLDFGIAKLLDDEDAAANAQDLTRMGGRVMTLRYAAPEQVSGGAITTAADIYALGVILHELVTGASPYQQVREGSAFTEAALLGEDPAMPSSVAPANLAGKVKGDIDAIILKAMRRDPAARYASIEQFDDDIQRHLDSRPVGARAGTWRYLVGRFVSRHRLPVVAAVAALLTLLIGVAMVEHERRVAVAEKARAEKHFASVRKLANVFVFDIHAEIKSLPGSLKAQEKLIQTSLQYLDNLAGEAGDDKSLVAELAVAYSKIGKIQGEHVEANLGMLADALANFEKSRSLFVSLGDFKADDNAFLMEKSSLYYSLARVYAQDRDPRWKENMVRAVQVAEQRARLKDASPGARGIAAFLPGELAYMSNRLVGQTPEAELEIAKSIAAMESLVREFPASQGLRSNLRGIYQRAGEIFSGDGTNAQSVTRAIELQRKALAICIAMVEEFPEKHLYKESLAENRVFLSRILAKRGQFDEARNEVDNALAEQRVLFTNDPKNATARLGIVQTLYTATQISERAGDFPQSIIRGREGLAQYEPLPSDVQKTPEARGIQTGIRQFLGLALLGTAGKPGKRSGSRDVLRNEGCALLRMTAQFNQEVLAVVDEGDAAELASGLAQCAS
jgi:eukaryotic-like serine/threonine-protein kinase